MTVSSHENGRFLRMKKTLVILCIALIMWSCVDEKYSTNASDKLEFSTSSLVMDTAFAESQTWHFMVYNRGSKALNIQHVGLKSGRESAFSINVDGRKMDNTKGLDNITVRTKDSLMVRVECTVRDADGEALFMMLRDTVTFLTNGNTQEVALEMTGRSATRLEDFRMDRDMTLVPGMPYLVAGYLYVPEGIKLTIEAGTEIFMHKGANIIVDGEIEIDGEIGNMVRIRGDRFDDLHDGGIEIPYNNIPGQWGGIYLQNAQGKNRIKGADIRSGGVGILLFGAGRARPELTIEDSKIHCFSSYGIYSQMGKVEILNSEISNCGQSCLMVVGGETAVQQSTIADYFTFATRKTAAVRVAGYAEQYGQRTLYPVERFTIENTVVWGAMSNELEIIKDTNETFNLWIANSMLKVKDKDEAWKQCVTDDGGKEVFVCIEAKYDKGEEKYFNFALADESAGRGIGDDRIARLYPEKLNGETRSTSDAGCW